MPLHTQIERNGELLALRWGGWHLICMETAAAAEGRDLWKEGAITLTQEHNFRDPADGELLTLKPGDILRCYR